MIPNSTGDAEAKRRRWLYYLLLLPPIGAAIVHGIGYNHYTLLLYGSLLLVFMLILLVLARGWVRDAALVLASILVCLVGFEAYQVVANPRALPEQSKGFASGTAGLGWGPTAAGSYSARKIDPKSGALVYDTTYTIDQSRLRKTLSAEAGPTVAFFGDSFTFGEGLPDSETLPQIFSDLEQRKLRVLNFGFPGYGPQQTLRALETRMYDELLRGSRLFVFETAAWHTDRTACIPSFMLRAPRYELRDGRAVYTGACAEGLNKALRELLGNSAAFSALLQPAGGAPKRADVDLYIAILERAVTLARETYGVPTLILYLPLPDDYLKNSGYTDQAIMQKLREGGAEVIDGTLNPADHPGVALQIPLDGHPSGASNRLHAEMLKAWWDSHARALLETQ